MDAVAAVVAANPRWSAAWAALGDCGRDDVEAYAAYRVGYHRGLDSLRGNGWRGSGYVRWEHPSNRGFLRSLAGLARQAAAIGEADEAERCAELETILFDDAACEYVLHDRHMPSSWVWRKLARRTRSGDNGRVGAV